MVIVIVAIAVLCAMCFLVAMYFNFSDIINASPSTRSSNQPITLDSLISMDECEAMLTIFEKNSGC